jgi:Na+(H+)/acetate symporter ActP
MHEGKGFLSSGLVVAVAVATILLGVSGLYLVVAGAIG